MPRGLTPLAERYRLEDLEVFSPEESARLLPGGQPPSEAAWSASETLPALVRWELLYRLEPELYDRLSRAEPLHPGILEWLPQRSPVAIEVGAGTGRLTLSLALRCGRLLAVEPAAPLRSILSRRLAEASLGWVTAEPGQFDAIPAADGEADLVIACSALTPHPAHGGEGGLGEMERVCAPGGRVVIVWPTQPDWLERRGYRHLTFPGPMAMRFASLDEAIELASIFHPHAVEAIAAAGSAVVPYELLGRPAPADVCWRAMPR